MKYNSQEEMKRNAIHIIIIWSNANKQKGKIIADIKNEFDIIKIIKVRWEKKHFLDNLKVFYAHSQKKLSPAALNSLMVNKMKHCGSEDFHVIVFRDSSPSYEKRKTSSGDAIVNGRVFDKKQLYRQWTGGGHKIHCSNDAWETNKDLTVLFGKNTEDFLKWIKEDDFDSYNDNCVGVNGFISIGQLFYLLNNTIKYCVLRNHECLPDEYTVEGHGDIDLLVENKNYIKYLTLAHDVHNLPYRVYHTIKVAGNDVPFDFRFLGDQYYDPKWEQDILNTRQFNTKGFFVPNKENQFYSLLYHAYIQKKVVADDYHQKLKYYADSISEKYTPSIKDAVRLLDCFLERKDYEYVKPFDKTVFFNVESLQFSSRAFRHGELISYNYQGDNATIPFFSVVYKNDDTYYKRASAFLIENELFYLKLLKDYGCFPNVLDYGIDGDESYLVTKKIEGEDFSSFFSSPEHMTPLYIQSFMRETMRILLALSSESIIHRDFIGKNLLIKECHNGCKVSLIDFGWAIKKNNFEKSMHPDSLGSRYAPKDGASDFYTLAMTIREKWPRIDYVNSIYRLLMSNNCRDGNEATTDCIKIIEQIEKQLNKNMGLLDTIRLFLRRSSCFARVRRKMSNGYVLIRRVVLWGQ